MDELKFKTNLKVHSLSLDEYSNVNIKEDFIFYPGSQEIALAEKGMFNFDHPDAFDWDLLERVLLVGVSQLNELKVIRYHR